VAITIFLDQRRSARRPDFVAGFSAELNTQFEGSLVRGFVRTAGDEMQGLLADPSALAAIVARALDEDRWWIGVGVGEVTRLGDSSRESAGPAFVAGRAAIEAAKRGRGSPAPLAVIGNPRDVAAGLHAALTAFAFVVQKRTARQREVISAVRTTSTKREAAARLEITPQGVSDALRASGYEVEGLLIDLITDLAAKATDG
jgi:hypothetical protein